MTAAHRLLPFGSVVQVKNLSTGRTATVRINNRGPFRKGRIIDVGILQKLGSLTRHANYGGGSAFSEDVISSMFVGVFSKFADAKKGSSVFYKTIDEALAYLEALKPGVTASVDWQAFITSLS